MISKLAISGYRSLRDCVLALGNINVVTGPNGAGKSNIYRALRLLGDVAQGRVIQSLAQEGGLNSTLWAGPEFFSSAMKRGDLAVQGTQRRGPVALKLGFSGDDYGYAIDLGLPVPSTSAFSRDPAIKAEALWVGETLGRSNSIALRNGPGVRLRDEDGQWQQAYTTLASHDSMMTHCSDPDDGLELLVVRERLRSWRYYDHLRTDRDAPARQPQIGTYTPVLASNGADLAAAIQTIREIGDGAAFDAAIGDAFDRAEVEVIGKDDGYFDLQVRQYGLLRPLRVAELSDGTLRYLLLVAALLSPDPPSLMVLNEPETSLHPDLLAPLARLVVTAARRTQLIIVTHAPALVEALSIEAEVAMFELSKHLGETNVSGPDKPNWNWPSRS